MANLIDMMAPEDQKLVRSWALTRSESKYKRDIPPTLYIAAQLGHYFGWQAVMDYRNKVISEEEAVGLIQAADKVSYNLIRSGYSDRK